MIEHEQLDAGVVRDPRGLFGRDVVVLDVVQ
jgi:hypothetical protein